MALGEYQIVGQLKDAFSSTVQRKVWFAAFMQHKDQFIKLAKEMGWNVEFNPETLKAELTDPAPKKKPTPRRRKPAAEQPTAH